MKNTIVNMVTYNTSKVLLLEPGCVLTYEIAYDVCLGHAIVSGHKNVIVDKL